jgi:hypothetical protein
MAHNARQGKRLATTAEAFNGYNQYNSGEWMWSGSFSDMDNYVYSNWSTCYGANGYYARTLSATSRIDRKLYEQIPETDVRRDLWFTYDKLDGIDPEDFYVAKNVNSQNLDITFRKGRRAAVAWLEDHNAPGFEGAYSASTDDSSAASPCICDGAQLKFFSGGLIGQDSFGFPPFMRATEMYLLEAEACAMLGQSSEAQAILNEVNQPRNPQYNCTLTGQSLIDEVRLYTRIELWGEGFCWFNLKRWGLPLVRESWKAGDVTSGNLPSIVECNVSPDAANLWRYGVPLSETNYNDQVTYPYPGNGLD